MRPFKRYGSAARRRRRSWGWLPGGLALVLAVAVLAHRVGYHRPRRPVPRPARAAAPAPRHALPVTPLVELARAAGLRHDPIPHARLVVAKSELTLRFYAGNRLLKTYPVALGFGGLGDKRRRDDGCTPEGEFRIVERSRQDNPRTWRDLFMLLNYPLPEDGARGVAAGLIDEEQRRAIVAAADRGRKPPQDTALGSGIGIHIGGIDPPNWTQGCIALERQDGIEVYEQVRAGTPVIVRR